SRCVKQRAVRPGARALIEGGSGGVGGSVLLRQPHGFEGFFAGSEPDCSHNESVSHGPDSEYPLLKPRPTSSAATNNSCEGENPFAVIGCLIDFDGVVLQLPEELLEGCEKAPVATINLRIREVGEVMPFHVRGKP